MPGERGVQLRVAERGLIPITRRDHLQVARRPVDMRLGIEVMQQVVDSAWIDQVAAGKPERAPWINLTGTLRQDDQESRQRQR